MSSCVLWTTADDKENGGCGASVNKWKEKGWYEWGHEGEKKRKN